MSTAEHVELFDPDRLYSKMASGKELTRQEAEVLIDAPAPSADVMDLRPYQPGPRREFESRVLVKLVNPDSQIGRIIIPDSAQRPTGECIVMDVGKGCWDEAQECWVPFTNIKVGDRIVIGRYVGMNIRTKHEIMVKDPETGHPVARRHTEESTILKLGDIMAKFEPV